MRALLLGLGLSVASAALAAPTVAVRSTETAHKVPKKKKKTVKKRVQRRPAAVAPRPDADVEGWQATRARVAAVAEAHPAGEARTPASRGAAPSTWALRSRASEAPPRGPGPGLPGFAPAGMQPTPLTPHALQVAEPAPAPTVRLAADGSLAWHGWTVAERLPARADRHTLATRERYAIDPILTWRAAAAVETPHATRALGDESNAGLDLGLSPSMLLDLLVTFAGVPVLERLSLGYERLDFDHGTVDLVGRGDGEVLQRMAFGVALERYEVGFRLLPPVVIFGRRLGWTLPRNVYLVEAGEGGSTLHQVSDRLITTRHGLWLVGVAIDPGRPADSGWLVGGEAAVGFGSYALRSAHAGLPLDGGELDGGQLSARLGYQVRLSPAVALGLRGELGVLFADPVGLPAGLRAAVQAENPAAAGDLDLTFGTVAVRQAALGFLRLDL
ncbi:MAG: hypothetical protein R3F43_28570 [bacterium]